ncbi:MAG: hypothetical protein AB7U98_10250 [Candidatus Nitrosocosmicus sp.]|jgi:hypothetical protein|uniref:hypothetical protein n=1 Tax=Candidatus Nitrosocosmicus sp. FF01 TaxID=3397670 RepID=UPI002A723499|nr:hypothetical protein [Candidatus Nitrosocosmicus sp.]GKS62501.1 hypothetical protein YTPLAS21_19590 [Candidatus Nitrosocosmicus sp.]
MISLKTQNPTLDTIKELSLTDLAIMSFTSQQLRKRLASYFRIDAFTAPDPFSKEDELSYFLVVDKSNTNRILAFIALKEAPDLDLWDLLFGKDMLRLDVSKEEAMSLKQQLMPKYTDNFFPIRKESTIIGYVAFTFEICGLKD